MEFGKINHKIFRLLSEPCLKDEMILLRFLNQEMEQISPTSLQQGI